MSKPLTDGAAAVFQEWAGSHDFAALARLRALLAKREEVRAGGLWGASQAMVLGILAAREDRPWLVVAASEAEADSLAADLETFGARPRRFPARAKSARAGTGGADVDAVRARLGAAQELAGPVERRPRLFVASVLALLQPLPTLAELERDFLRVSVGQVLHAEALLRKLVKAGYTRAAARRASRRGELARRHPRRVPLRQRPAAANRVVRRRDRIAAQLRPRGPALDRELSAHRRLSRGRPR